MVCKVFRYPIQHKLIANFCPEHLINELEALTNIKGDPLALCQAAKKFSDWKTLARLLGSSSSIDTRSPWASLWHYVGRLGCWFGKCENLFSTASQYPQLLENARCEFLALPRERKLPVKTARVDLASALKRMLSADQQSLAPRLYDQLADMRLFDIPVAFSENFTDESLEGRVHAEVFLMEHFYFNKFRLLSREKYIGCSKPSCYCCSLYFRYHPGNFVLRPAHNNVYVTWVPPLMSQLDEERQRKHNLDIMNQMNAYMRRDIKEEIEERMPRREKAPDSTDGIDSCSFLSQ